MTHNEEERMYGVPKKYDQKKWVKKMVYQRSTTQKKSEKDGVPNKYDPKKMERESVKKKGAVIYLVHRSDQ